LNIVRIGANSHTRTTASASGQLGPVAARSFDSHGIRARQNILAVNIAPVYIIFSFDRVQWAENYTGDSGINRYLQVASKATATGIDRHSNIMAHDVYGVPRVLLQPRQALLGTVGRFVGQKNLVHTRDNQDAQRHGNHDLHKAKTDRLSVAGWLPGPFKALSSE
jgi:hypothetical protein